MYRFTAALALSAALLAACGGGSDTNTSPDTTPVVPAVPLSAKGLWMGSTSSTTQPVTGVVLGDGTYWFLYGTSGGGPVSLRGMVQGSSAVSAEGRFQSSDGRDFNAGGLGLNTVVIGSNGLGTQSFINGFVMYPSGISVGFNVSYDADFERTPSLAAVAGSFPGTAVTLDNSGAFTLTANSSGALSGSNGGSCTLTGQLTPRTDGNVFDASFSYGASCPLPSMAFTGVAYFRASTRALYLTGTNALRTQSLSFTGVRPS
jgi:hypothetical protein